MSISPVQGYEEADVGGLLRKSFYQNSIKNLWKFEEEKIEQNTAILLRHVISAGCVIEDKIDVTPGKHIKMIGNVESFDQCAMKAAEIKNAKFWTYQPSTKNCWPKASDSKKVPLEGVVSGNVECGTAEEGCEAEDDDGEDE